jgi:hypothetical protein
LEAGEKKIGFAANVFGVGFEGVISLDRDG